jgi:hypothetical protein
LPPPKELGNICPEQSIDLLKGLKSFIPSEKEIGSPISLWNNTFEKTISYIKEPDEPVTEIDFKNDDIHIDILPSNHSFYLTDQLLFSIEISYNIAIKNILDCRIPQQDVM